MKDLHLLKIIISEKDCLEIDISAMHNIQEQAIKAISLQWESIMKQAFESRGVDMSNLTPEKVEALGIRCIKQEGDPYDHYYLYYGTSKQVPVNIYSKSVRHD